MTDNLSRSEVLRSFSSEESLDQETLNAYVKRYPMFAADLAELSLEMELDDVQDSAPDTRYGSSDHDRVKAALSGDKARGLAKSLGLPRVIVGALRDRSIRPETLPQSFLRRTSQAAEIGKAHLMAYLCLPKGVPTSLSMKADGKPGVQEKVDFNDFISGLDLEQPQLAQMLDNNYDHGSD